MDPNAHKEFEADLLRSPEWLRTLLAAELTAGNEVVEVFHSFPAPPVGACFRLAKPLITRPPQANDGLDYYLRNSSLYAAEITDSQREFFIVEPPLPPPPEPDMDAIRAARQSAQDNPAPPAASSSLVAQFKSSMVRDYERWHDGIGYEVQLLAQMNDDQRVQVEQLLLQRVKLDWFDVEALAILNTSLARDRLRQAADDDNYVVRHAVQQYAPSLMATKARTESLVQALKETRLYGGLSQALDEAAEFHPPEVIQTLLDGTLHRDGESATLMAGLLYYIHGLAPEPFDMRHRPFFLRFNTTDQVERAQAFAELCDRIGQQQA